MWCGSCSGNTSREFYGRLSCRLCGDDRQKAVVFWLVIVPAGKFLRLLIDWHWNFFLLTLKAKLLSFAFDYGRIILQVINFFLQIEIFTRQLFNFLVEAFVLFSLTPQLGECSEIYCEAKNKSE
jgi:hypothetical protein